MFGRSKRDKKRQQGEQNDQGDHDPIAPLIGNPEEAHPAGRPMMTPEFPPRGAHESPSTMPNTSAPAIEEQVHEEPSGEEAIVEALEPDAPVESDTMQGDGDRSDEGPNNDERWHEEPRDEQASEHEAPLAQDAPQDTTAAATALIERIQSELTALKAAESARDEDAHRHAQREAELSSELHSLREQHQVAEHALHEAREQTHRLEHERNEAHAEAERLRHEHQHQNEGRLHELEHVLNETNERAQRLQHDLDASHAEVERLRAEHAQSLEHQSQHEARLQELTKAIGAMEARVGETEDRAALAEQRCQSLAESNAALEERARQQHAREIAPDEFCKQRRARLGVVRRSLQERSQQLFKVKKVLEHKAEELKDAGSVRQQAEQMLFEAREQKTQIERAFTTIMSMRAKGATGVFLAGLAIAWVTLLGASWVGVSMFVPVEHNAHTAIACDVRGLQDPEASEAAWTEFAMALPEDPMFLERVAQRMKTRSYDELSSPSDMRTFLASSAVFDSPAPGRLNVTIRAEGEGRSQRVLETIATGVVAYANETRDRRADNAPAAVIEPAAAEAQPIDDPRPAIAAGVAGGLTALLLVIAVAAWRSARKAVMESGREAIAAIEHTPSSAPYETPPATEAGGVGMRGMSG